MPVPSSIDDLSTTAASNSPSGSDSVGSVDDHLRAQASFIAQLRDEAVELFDTTDPGFNGLWPDVTAATKIIRGRDRLFVGGGAAVTGNRSGTQGGLVPTATEGANWAIRDAQFLSFATQGNMAIVGFSRSEDIDAVENTAAIGISGFAIANNATKTAFAGYLDLQFESGTTGYGLEVAVKNKTTDRTSTPYFATSGTFGIQLSGGGDATYGGAAANPNNTGILFLKNSSTWNRGIVFLADSITGTDGTTGTGTAIELAKGHIINWRAPGNIAGFGIRSDVSSASSDVALVAGNNVITLFGTGGVRIAAFSHSTSAENYFTFQNRAAASGGPRILAQGPGSDVDLEFLPQGAGVMRFGSHSAIAAETLSGYITIKDTGGTVRKLAVIS